MNCFLHKIDKIIQNAASNMCWLVATTRQRTIRNLHKPNTIDCLLYCYTIIYSYLNCIVKQLQLMLKIAIKIFTWI